MPEHNQAAPGDLESVRSFINTWSIPNETRVATDTLPSLINDPTAWQKHLSLPPLLPGDTLKKLLQLRDDLRAACENPDTASTLLNAWFSRVKLTAQVNSVAGTSSLVLKPADATCITQILAIVANAIASGDWPRLKTCGDCRWAFHDHTRNGSKRWCGMSKGGPDGRACGTIAKVNAFRSRAALKAHNE